MKTKIIPFDLEMAKKIQAGEIEGKIIYNSSEAEILDFNMYFKGYTYVCAKVKKNSGEYTTRLFDRYGKDEESNVYYKLVLEVPDTEQQFKPFDKVLVRANNEMCWKPTFYVSTEITEDNKTFYETIGGVYHEQCIPYEGNEKLVGTIDKPKEKE